MSPRALGSLMQDGSPSPIVCLGLAWRTERGQKYFQSEIESLVWSQKSQSSEKVRRESGDAKTLSVCGGDQSRATGEGFGEGQGLLQGKELLGRGGGGGGGGV